MPANQLEKSTLYSPENVKEAIKRFEERFGKPYFNVERICFDKQIDFIRDPAKRKVACNSRRSGKTFACASDMLDCARHNPGINCLYITLSRLNAKRIIWKDLVRLNEVYFLDGVPNLSELTLTLPNRSTIYLAGAHDQAEIEKFRGMAFKLVYIDEAQSFKSYLENLVNDVLSASLYDYNGTLNMIGTPGAVCAGAFFDACHNKGAMRGFKPFQWTIFDNPHIEKKSGKKVKDLIEEELSRKGLTEDDPSVARETFGKWVEDQNALVYKFSEAKNLYEELPAVQFNYAIGIDLGWDDADAIVVWAYSRDLPYVYLVEEWKKSKQTVSDLAETVKAFQVKYPQAKMVIDTGGLGKKITEELVRRHGLAIEAADKARKLEFIELMNDDFRTGKIKVPTRQMEIKEEWRILQWDREKERPVEDERFDNHLADAALYSWRSCFHFIHREKVNDYTNQYTDKWAEEWERKEIDRAIKERQEVEWAGDDSEY